MLKGLLSTIWIFSVPKSPLDLVNVYPTTLLAAVHYAFSRGRPSLGLVGLAFLWDMGVGFWLMVGAFDKPSRSLLRALMDLKDCTYSPIELDRLLDDSKRALLARKSLLEYLRRAGLPWNHARDVSIFCVEMGPSGSMISGLAAFKIPFLGAVLLVRDDPEQAAAPERFAFWHEVGHTLGGEFARQSMLEKGTKGAFASILLSLLLLKWSVSSVLLVVMFVFSLLLLKRAYGRLGRSHRLDSECTADGFALQFMDPADLEDLRGGVAGLVPNDGELSDSQIVLRRTRLRMLLDNVDLTSRQVDSEMLEFVWDAFLASLNLVGWMVLIASHFRTVQPRDLYYFLWGVSFLVAAAIGRYLLSYWLRVLADMILLGSRCWRDGRFEFGGH